MTEHKQKIVVAGDLIRDFHLVRHDLNPAINPRQLKNPILSVTAGGAWYLQDMIGYACSDIPNPRLDISGIPKTDGRGAGEVNESYSIWSRYSRSLDSKDQVWRVERFLGTKAPERDVHPVTIQGDTATPDLLVLDDLGGSFRTDSRLWPLALGKRGNPRNIILKTQAPVAQGEIWQRLKEFADRLTVVISVVALRARDAHISEGLSWDKTIGEIDDEFKIGKSAQDLALCRQVIVHFNDSGAAIFTRCRMKLDEASAKQYFHPEESAARLLPAIRLDRFIYHPIHLEGVSMSRMPGGSFGATTIMTAAIARHYLAPENYPINIAIKRGLEAISANHQNGAGDTEFNVEAPINKVKEAFHPDKAEGDGNPPGIWPYCAAFPHALLSDSRMRSKRKPDLLQDFTGAGYEYVVAVAADVVRRGWERALQVAPKVHFGKYITVDSEEIENINDVRKKIEAYRTNKAERVPLSFAVFGPPGSGKSFAVTELAKELFKDKKEIIEHLILKFNLTQVHSVEMLHEKFHKIRTAGILGEIPIVFWDEFDTEDLRWLKYFLVPMADGEFESSAGRYPLGKAIFIFAGGTSSTFKSFDLTGQKTPDGMKFKSSKGPDFVSRLQGSIDIKGPNNVGKPGQDIAHVMRRAVLLRSAVERFQPRAIDSVTREISISPGVLRAFLRVQSYTHGARSLEAIVRMATLTDGYFGNNGLPAEALKNHASPDFHPLIDEGEMEWQVVEALAEAVHEAWKKERERQGWSYAKKRDDTAKTSPQLVGYAQLSELDKELNRNTARLTYAKLHDVGLCVSLRTRKPAARYLSKAQFNKKLDSLIRIEHDIWLRDHLLRGYDWAVETNDELRRCLLHRDITTFEKMTEQDKANDHVIAESVYDGLKKHGYALERVRTKSFKNGKQGSTYSR
ncbi:MAG TPA: RyR domain-containing protein [Candidatus Angelobacter sp.]|nr:RyR domain-containing protein [Candidatus Angelobacter sp.]